MAVTRDPSAHPSPGMSLESQHPSLSLTLQGSGLGAPLRRALEALLCSSLPTSSPRGIMIVFLADVMV